MSMVERLRENDRFLNMKRRVELLTGDYACNGGVASCTREISLSLIVSAICRRATLEIPPIRACADTISERLKSRVHQLATPLRQA